MSDGSGDTTTAADPTAPTPEVDQRAEPDDTNTARAKRAEQIRTEMGGAAKVAGLHADGQKTIRDHIDSFLDPDTFREIGTFSRSMRHDDRASTPGDGKIGGHGLADGRPVAVFGDDITVKRGSSSIVGGRKEQRLYDRAMAMGTPVVHFGQTGGGRIPDLIGSEGISEAGELFTMARRRHEIPMATAIVGHSFGGSSFLSALSDFVVMTRGSTLAVTSPKVFEIATGEVISFEDVGGVDVHARTTGQIDLGVETDTEAYAAIRRWLSYLPSNIHQRAPRAAPAGDIGPDPGLVDLVPARRTRGYDMRRVVARICDDDSVFELQPNYARSVTTGMARLDGWSVGFIANNPMFNAGVLDPQACHKIIRLTTVCDSFNIPIIWLVDVPGFMVGKRVEHDLMLHWGMKMMQALQLASTPTLTVCLRKAFGLAWQAMNGAGMVNKGLYAWPGSEIGFMDPDVGVNVAYGTKLDQITDPEEREAERARLVAEVGEATSPYEAAGTMKIDEIIDPADTRRILADDLAMLANRPLPPPEARVLASWPTC
ncbi:MAG: methylmalonyl-CoA carboxyltransferase [Actinomycetia bacterium]|nr:methylmalonyl-CoA carboxyltransferase [Actinomycetes bacterium]